MQIYKDTSNPDTQEFKKLLNSEFSKNKNVEEGKVIECTVKKITDNYCYLSADGLKQEPVLDTRELSAHGLLDKIKENSKIEVLLERLEHPKTGEIIVSYEKAVKLAGWKKNCRIT